MITTLREIRQLGRQYRDYSRRGLSENFHREFHDVLRSGQINTDNLRLRPLFEEFVPDGREILEEMDHTFSNFGIDAVDTVLVKVREAGDAITTSAFSALIGQISYNRVLDRMQGPNYIADRVSNTVQSNTQEQEIVPGIATMGDVAEHVGEAEQYPHVGLTSEYIIIPRKLKDGFIVPVSKEALLEDKTGLLPRRVDKATDALLITMEKERLSRGVLGLVKSYRRNGGPAQNTYDTTHTQGDFDNIIGNNPLIDWTYFNACFNRFDELNDPETGEPIMLSGSMDLVVPTPLYMDAVRILNATEVARGERAVGSYVTTGGNPLRQQQRFQINIESNQYIQRLTGSNDTTYFGDSRSAFVYHQNWAPLVQRLGQNSWASFNRDIVMALKVSRKGVQAVEEPRYMLKCLAGAIP